MDSTVAAIMFAVMIIAPCLMAHRASTYEDKN